jgi:ParB-like chromosome segregation protein Spo0J
MQMNEACTLKIRQIMKNPPLALGVSKKDVGKYKKLADAYGNAAPVTVSETKDGTHIILEGCAKLEAFAQAGIDEIHAVKVNVTDSTGQLKLALMLSVIHEGCGALSEGALISQLVKEYKVAPRELAYLLGKSKAWISKRATLVENLSNVVKGMVTDGTLCPRSAEEVAKLPMDDQVEFAGNAVNAGLNKTEIGQLVQRYKNADTDEVRREVVKAPLAALSKESERPKKKPAKGGLNGPGAQLAQSANYASQMTLKVMNMMTHTDDRRLIEARAQLERLRDVSTEAGISLNQKLSDISLGKL